MIINTRADLDSLPEADQQTFKARLAGTIYGWSWTNGEWVQTTNTTTIEQFEFTLADFPDAPVPDKPTNNPDEDAKLGLATSLNNDVGQYIYTRYDAGTQASFQAIYADEDTPLEAKAAIKGMWDWIKSVMNHYYTCKNEVLAGTRTEWDFSQFDATDPGLNLEDFV